MNTTEIDLDIVSDTFRAFVDQAAFDSLIESWNQKLNALEADVSVFERHFSTAFFKQMDLAADTLDRLDAQAFEDPLERLVSEVSGPAVVISPDLRVASVNAEGKDAFGASQGMFLSLDCMTPETRMDFDALLRTHNGRGNRAQAIVQILDPGTDEPAFRAEAFLYKTANQDGCYIVMRSLELNWTPEVSASLGDGGSVARSFGAYGAHPDEDHSQQDRRNVTGRADPADFDDRQPPDASDPRVDFRMARPSRA